MYTQKRVSNLLYLLTETSNRPFYYNFSLHEIGANYRFTSGRSTSSRIAFRAAGEQLPGDNQLRNHGATDLLCAHRPGRGPSAHTGCGRRGNDGGLQDSAQNPARGVCLCRCLLASGCIAEQTGGRSVAWHRAKGSGQGDPYPYLLLASKWPPSADSMLMCI